MPGKVLVGVDGQFGGRDAIALAQQLMAQDGQLVLAHAVPCGAIHCIATTTTTRPRSMCTRATCSPPRARRPECGPSSAGAPAPLRGEGCTSWPSRSAPTCWSSVPLCEGYSDGCWSETTRVQHSTERHARWPSRRSDTPNTRTRFAGSGSGTTVAPTPCARSTWPERSRMSFDASLAALEVVAYPACVFRAPDAGDNASVRELISDARDRVASIGDDEAHSAYGHAAEELARWGETVDLLVVGSRGYGPAGRLVAREHVSCTRPSRALSVLVLTHSAAVAPAAEASMTVVLSRRPDRSPGPRGRNKMFNNVVVGIDDDEGGRDAIALAKMLAAGGAKLTFVQVYQGDSAVSRATRPDYEAKQHDRIRELLEMRRAEAGVEAELRWYGSPSVGRGLHELAELTGADLLVIGSSRRGLLRRVLIGDDTRAALNGAPCAVAIAPAGQSRAAAVMREVGVGYDGSPESKRALELARMVAAGSIRRRFRRSRRFPLPRRPVSSGISGYSGPGRGSPRSTARWTRHASESRRSGASAARRLRGPGRGAHGLQRLPRSARRRVEGLRPARQAGLRRCRAAPRPDRALPAACFDAIRADGARRARPGDGRAARAHRR